MFGILLMLIFVIYVYSMVYTINYVLYGRMMVTNEGNSTKIMPLSFSSFCGCVRLYNGTIVTDWYVVDDDDIELCQPSAHPFPKE